MLRKSLLSVYFQPANPPYGLIYEKSLLKITVRRERAQPTYPGQLFNTPEHDYHVALLRSTIYKYNITLTQCESFLSLNQSTKVSDNIYNTKLVDT